MKLKNMGKMLSFVILLNTIPFNSLASTIPNESRYEVFKGNSITVKDNYDVNKKDVSIAGNTVVNCLSDVSGISNSQTTTFNKKNNTITIEHLDKKDSNSRVRFFDSLVETGETYTLIFNIVENTLQRDEGDWNWMVGKFNIVNYNTGGYNIPSGDLGLKKIVLKQPQTSTHNGKPYFEVLASSVGKIVIKDIMLLKGDWGGRETPSYFKGIKSVGQDDENGHNIEILAQNVEFAETMQTNPSDIGDELTIQLEKGVLSTDYQQGFSNNKKILLNEPLRGFSSKLKDEIVKINGKWFIKRVCKEINLNGSIDEVWSKRSNSFPSDKTQLFCFYITDSSVMLTGIKNLFCNNFISRGGTSTSERDWECIFLSENGDEVGLYLRIDNSKLDTLDVSGLRKWLEDNPMTVICQLNTPIYEPLNIEPTVSLYEGVTYISNNSTIPCEMSVTVDRTLNIANKYVELAKTSPTIDNLSRARSWINLLDDSMIKDQLQAEINDISEITDLTFEKKSTTSDLDIYIKSQNMLSLSLDTNSIVFNDFSGVEDVIKENAINLTVSSSLPYAISAYLESEIQNSDKSKTMDKSVLNIKESSETSYKEFDNTKSKLVLKDGCAKGNNISHGIDLKLKGSKAHKADAYKTTIKLEVEQK